MAFMDTSYEDDGAHVIMTTVSVHSPVIQNSKNGTFYTSYAINLKTNSSCFTLPQSCVRRRYSEFVHLRGLLKIQHPAIDPPLLPPKNYFSRFNHSFVAQRAEGLEIFLKNSLPSTGSTESSSASSSINVHLYVPSLTPKQSEECDCGSQPVKPSCSVLESKPINITTNSDLGGVLSVSLSTCHSALSDTNEKSLSSASSSPDSERGGVRRVSFNEEVTVAVIQNKLWNYAVKPIKAGAC